MKTAEGYKPLSSAAVEESPAVSRLARAVNSFLLDIRPAQNMLVLKTPPGGAQPWLPPWIPNVGRKWPARWPVTTPY